MKLKGVILKGFRIGKDGRRVERDPKRLDVSARLRAKAGKRIKVARRTSPR